MTVDDRLANPDEARLARHATGLLRRFNEAGVLDAADVHVARRLGRLGGEGDETVLLAAALAARAPRLGHVCVELKTIAATAGDEEGAADPDLPWPEPDAWLATLRDSPLIGEGRPLRLDGSLCYLDRLHGEECRVAAALDARARTLEEVSEASLEEGLERLFPDDGAGNLQRFAAATAVRRHLAVIAGGPGTGKTTTVARVLALLEAQASAAGAPPPLVALAAPTGKAAARLEEAVREETARLGVPLPGGAERWTASTLHRLLGTLPDSSTRFRHDETRPLVHDVVVVDEASMLSLSLMDRLLAAVRPNTRLILLGDPEQLASVEAGVVLGDIVEPATTPNDEASIVNSVVVLRRIHRFGGAIAALAGAVRDGDAGRAVALLREGGDQLSWVEEPTGGSASEALEGLRASAVGAWERVANLATAGAGAEALEALGAFRVLCAHRAGPAGATGWSERTERWLTDAGLTQGRRGSWLPGQPLLLTVNDYDLRLFNGDTGVVVTRPSGHLAAVFERGGEVATLSLSRLSHIETCFAMTVHKAQGSQFDAVAVVLPDAGSRILTRQLLYTGITRARRKVTVVGSEESLVAAVEKPIARASGLQQRLREHPAPATFSTQAVSAGRW